MVTLELTFCKVSLKLKKHDWLETSSIYSVFHVCSIYFCQLGRLNRSFSNSLYFQSYAWYRSITYWTHRLYQIYQNCIFNVITALNKTKKIITFGKFIKQWMYWVLEQQTDAGESYEHNICLTLCRFWHNQITHSPRIIHSACYVSFPFATVYFPTI